MIPNLTTREVRQSSQVTDVGGFGISHKDSAHIKRILRSQLYSDKVTAVLREYGSNAWDANQEAGRGDEPIEVVLPTMASPTLVIRDHGPGLSPDDVRDIYRWYGVSTKRGSNVAVGCLGLGSKSGFAYGDSFTIVSRHGGRCRTYVACLDAGDSDDLKLLADVDAPNDPTGVEVHVAVRPADVEEFCQKAGAVFQWFSPHPRGVDLPPPNVMRHPQGTLTDHDKWVAVMGCVGYPVDLTQLRDVNFAAKLGGVLHFSIGELSIAASRESLEYTDATRARLTAAINSLIDAEIATLMSTLEAEPSSWRRRLLARKSPWLSQLESMKGFRDIFSTGINVKWPCNALALQRSEKSSKNTVQKTSYVLVDERTRFVVADVSRKLSYYALSKYDVILSDGHAPTWRRRGIPQVEIDATYARVLALVAPKLVEHGLTDVPVVRLSQLRYNAPTRKVRVVASGPSEAVKHKKTSMLRLRRDVAYESPYSKCWESVEREALPSDVTVAVDRFCNETFFKQAAFDAKVAGFFGVDLPEVFAWRKVEGQTQPGVDYAEWRKTLRSLCLAASTDAQQMIADRAWCGKTPSFDLDDAATAERRLGVGHPLARVIRGAADAAARRRRLGWQTERAVSSLCLSTDSDRIRADVAAVKAAYPLLNHGGFERLDSSQDRDAWLNYVADIDSRKKVTP